MRNLLHVSGLTLCLWFQLGSAAWSGPPSRYMPEGSGVVNGQSSVVVLPRRYDSVSDSSDYLDPAGLEVHLTNVDDPDEELAFPAGSWFQPPHGRYRVWLQGGWRMTPFSADLRYSGQAAEEYITFGLPVGEAGRVTLPAAVDADSNLDLHLLYAGSYLEEGLTRWEVSPRRPTTEMEAGVLLPAGNAVGLLWNRKSHTYVALSRPFKVRAGVTVEAPLAKPGAGADLVVQVERRLVADKAADLAVQLVLKQAGAEREPDLAVFTADKVYAFWYGLEPGPAELTGESERDFLEPRQIDLLAGKIERVAAELKARPALEVQLDLPVALRHEKLALEVRRSATGEILEHRSLEELAPPLAPPLAPQYRFERLPPAPLEVELQTGAGSFSRQVDLSSGEDGFLLLKPELITVSGTVYHGDEGHRATLTFANAARTIEARSGDDGRYEAVFLDPVQTVSIALDGVESAPYFDFFRPAIAQSKELDFHLPDGDFRVNVLDAVTGEGIPRAAVEIRNTFFQERDRDEEGAPRRTSTDKNERAVFQTATADETGMARLPPLREGTLEIQASAKGYSAMREALKVQILDAGAEQVVEVKLEPAGETVSLRLRLPNGTPAAGAELLLVDSLGAGNRLFSARSDGQGLARVPLHQPGFLLIKHPATAFLVRDWRPSEEDGELEWVLSPAADRPLRVMVKNASGEGVVARADLVLWVDGRRLSGAALAWLAGSIPTADSSGVWIGRNLPRAAMNILAWNPRMPAAGAGPPDSEAMAVAYPWADVVEIRAAE
jgi:hypothetical protein